MCCSLLDGAYDVAYALSGIVLQQNMDMVLIRLHSNDIPMVLLSKIVDSFLNELVYAVLQ